MPPSPGKSLRGLDSKARMGRLREARAREKKQEVDIARMAKALGHPTRIAILEALSGSTCTCGDVVDGVARPQSTVSQHLRALKSAGWITSRNEGPCVCYSLDARAVREFRRMLEPRLAIWEERAQLASGSSC